MVKSTKLGDNMKKEKYENLKMCFVPPIWIISAIMMIDGLHKQDIKMLAWTLGGVAGYTLILFIIKVLFIKVEK